MYAHNFSAHVDSGQNWTPGEIVEITGPVSCKVQFDMGSIIGKHVDHIRRRRPVTMDVTDGMDKNLNSPDSGQQTEVSGRAETSTPTKMGQRTTPEYSTQNNDSSETASAMPDRHPEGLGELPENTPQDNPPQPSEVAFAVPERRSERLRKPPKYPEDFVYTYRPK